MEIIGGNALYHKVIYVEFMSDTSVIHKGLPCYIWHISVICISGVVHYDVIKWKHFPRYWPFVRGIQPVTGEFPLKGQWQGALVFSMICALNKRLSKQSWGWWFPLFRTGSDCVANAQRREYKRWVCAYGTIKCTLRVLVSEKIQHRDTHFLLSVKHGHEIVCHVYI